MQELQEINPQKDTATDAMCMFLAINTSSVQLILPATVVGLMGTAANQVFLSTLLATGFSTITGITAAKLFARLPQFALVEGDNTEVIAEPPDSDLDSEI